ncbi:hypothetical protein [Sorangium sp. So ce513]|uniref:hypothetical protein n=1 Tax=Sorangium sp. So ce513 TaxID=3133315 RepID=UPI003F5EEC98
MPWCHGCGDRDGRGGDASTAAGGGSGDGGDEREGGCGDSDPGGGPDDCPELDVPELDDPELDDPELDDPELDDPEPDVPGPDVWACAGAAQKAHKATRAIDIGSFAAGKGTCMGCVWVVLLCGGRPRDSSRLRPGSQGRRARRAPEGTPSHVLL